MNGQLNPLFAQIVNAAAARTDSTPAGAVPVPRALPSRGPAYGSRAGQTAGALYQCNWCQGGHSRENDRGFPKAYCSNACELAEDGC